MKYPHLAWIRSVWREKQGLIWLLLLLTLLSSAVAVAFPLVTKYLFDVLETKVVDAAGADAAMAQVKRIALMFVAIGLAGFVAGTFPGIRGSLNSVFDYLVRTRYFKIVLRKRADFFATFRSGDIIARLTSDIADVPKLSWFLCSGIFRAVESASKVTFCVAAMFSLDWRLALASLVSLPFMLLVFVRTQNLIYDRVARNEKAISGINDQLEMSFSGARVIKAFAAETQYAGFFRDALARRFKTEMDVIRLDTVMHLIYQYIDYVAQIALVFAGGILVTRREISIGTFYAFYNYLNMLIYPILDIPTLFTSGKRSFVNIDRLEEMRNFGERKGEGDSSPGRPQSGDQAPFLKADNGRMPGAAGVQTSWTGAREQKRPAFRSLVFEHVWFTYPGRGNPALQNISFSISAGEKILVIGPIGCGKTTMVKLALGILEPSSGRILLDGAPLDPEDETWRSMVGYVPQDPLLFSGTIRDNILFGDRSETLSDRDLMRIVEASRLTADIGQFPDGLETTLGQRGSRVSGGQRQRIAIARALAGFPSLLLFDDMTAALDSTNEELLWQSLSSMPEFAKAAVLAVSHRLSSIQYVDKVLYLEGGCLCAFGKHEELLATCEGYRTFVARHLQAGTDTGSIPEAQT
ncbi:MAG: ABC transporter ATP-binding protein [Rectinemataceae bacterium]|nr:ABC transporter ATP-binding protein/permease [Spirochaetaceae bacterium]